MSTYCRQSKIMLVILLIWALTLSGCGAGNPNQLSEPNSDPQDSSVNSPSQPSGPDDPVSGQPGQGGNAALGNTVQGRVTDAAGQPLAEVIVTPQSTDTPPQAVPEIAVFSGPCLQAPITLPSAVKVTSRSPKQSWSNSNRRCLTSCCSNSNNQRRQTCGQAYRR